MPLPPRVPDLAALDLLLSVIELGSLGRAAAAHGISQPSASSRIRSLERLIGVSVLERSTLGSKPTAAGALVAEWSRDVVDSAYRLASGIDALREQRDSHLEVAASQTVAEYLFPAWLTGLRTRVPGTAIALRSGNSSQVAQDVLESRAQVGFIEGPDVPDGLVDRPVGRDQLLIVVGTGHAWARRSAVTLDELRAAPLIHREPGSGTRTAFEKAIRVDPEWQMPVLLELSSTTAIKSAVASGIGPAVLSSLAVAADVAAGVLTPVRVTGLDIRRVLRAVWLRGQQPAGPVRDLLVIALSGADGIAGESTAARRE